MLILFGAYRGTAKDSGFRWTNPLNTKQLISLRARNLNGEKLKVNDKRGNPIEIAAVVVWRVDDTAQACFDVDNYVEYVEVQSESAVRHLANCYAYDHGEGEEVTLRSGVEEVSSALQQELQERLAKAGVLVEMALRELAEKEVVTLDEERKATMVGNLLVVLCGETEAQPIINTGTLYA